MWLTRGILSCLLTAGIAQTAVAQTTIDGNDLALRSSGANAGGGAWSLDNNGYVGTYITLDAPGEVTISVAASGLASGGIDPRMNLVVADATAGFDVSAGGGAYEHTFSLSSGTHFVRTEFNNDFERSGRQLIVEDISITGATVVNTSSNANALAAADTYINHYRKGNVTIALSGVAPGTEVGVSLTRHAFNFGTAVPGTSANSVNTFLGAAADPNSTAYKFQQALAESKFNALVPENAGKWASNAGFSPSFVNMGGVDAILNFAETNDLGVRMHNLIWGSQQPNWVNGLISQAASGDTTAINTLRAEISERIDYYVADRAQRYYELDVYNESVHTPEYWDIYNDDGIAAIYNEVAQAVAEAGGDARLFTNEYNVLQDNGDFYGNWYLRNIEDIVSAGGAVSGIGVQSYENNAIGTSQGAHNPARKMQTLQNLSVLGLPITLTEFGVKDPTNESDAATMLDETVRLVFGTPNAAGFFMWGFWRGEIFRGAAAFYDEDWNLTQAGERWQDLMSAEGDADPNDDWDTQLNAIVDENGAISFDGYWGDYELAIGDAMFDLELLKGMSRYSLVVAPGDYNADGSVDAADYTVWRDSLGSTENLLADGDGDGMIDAGDYDVWKVNFGAVYTSGGETAASLPEPASALLSLAATVLFWFAGARRRGRYGRFNQAASMTASIAGLGWYSRSNKSG
jgi:GH35 family endo-1,4-beta-xylanase